MFKKKRKISPILSFILLTFLVILLSGILHLFNVQAEYSTVDKAAHGLVNNVIEVKNLLSTSGIKHIITNAVNDFVNFPPLSILIIILIGIGVLEKSGFTKTAFTLITKNAKKNSLTFTLILICLILSIFGDIGYAIMIPLGALIFKYGRRNPLGGIIATFASLSFGTGINIFLSSTDSSLLTLSLNAAKTIDPKYTIGSFFALFIMIIMLIITAIIFTQITEKKIMPKLPRYESDEEVIITNKELRGLIIGSGCGILYLLIILYMIIPGLPLSGGLLDNNATIYIDKLLGVNSLFSKGFIFIVTIFFIIVGLSYGLMAKTIKNSKDVTESLAYSLDGIGSIIVLIFFASIFINTFELSNIGQVLTALSANIIGSLKFTGIGLILITILILIVTNFICPNPLTKWTILSATVIPVFMNASISPEFTQIIFSASDSITNGITPLMIFFVIYIAFLEKYDKNNNTTLVGGIKYMISYSLYILIIWCVVITAWYMIGVPIGIGSLPGVVYGS